MCESDDETYVTYGVALEPLDEDNLPRKKPITVEEQFAYDDQGRRRFHGAFTGGFSAGYFNSVGTRDGWRPQQFKSSRSSKAESAAQRPEDFMDEEDTAEFGIAPSAIRATGSYTDFGNKGSGRKRERTVQDSDGPIPGTPVLRELLKPVKETVGSKLLKQMGWKPGQGVGPRVTKTEKTRVRRQNENIKVYGCSMPPGQDESIGSDYEASDDDESSIMFAPDDYEPFRCAPKDNYFGIGYSGLDRRPVLSGHVNLFESPVFSLQDKNKKLSIRGQAFGVGAFEADDEDIYAREDMSQYDFALEPKSKAKSKSNSRWAKDDPEISQNRCVEGFRPAENNVQRRKIFKPPELPVDFDPVHVVRKSRFEPAREATEENSKRKAPVRLGLNAEERAVLINDPSCRAPVPSGFQDQLSDGSDKGQGDDISILAADSSGNQSGVNELLQPKNVSVISNIITRTLNLHGAKQTELNQRQSVMQQTNMNIDKSVKFVREGEVLDSTKTGRICPSEKSKTSWLEKLNAKSFVKEGSASSENPQSVVPDGKSSLINAVVPNSSANLSNELSMEVEILDKETPDKTESLRFKPFAMNADKQKRFEQFLIFTKTDQKDKLLSVQPLSMTEWDRDHEKAEFEQAAKLQEPLTLGSSRTPVSVSHREESDPLTIKDTQLREAARMKMFGKLTRQKRDWQPVSILCKRFNVPEPRSGYAEPEVRKKKGGFSVFDCLKDSTDHDWKFQKATDATQDNSRGDSSSGLLRNSTQLSARFSSPDLKDDIGNSSGNHTVKTERSEKERTFEAKYEEIFGKKNIILGTGNISSVVENNTVEKIELLSTNEPRAEVPPEFPLAENTRLSPDRGEQSTTENNPRNKVDEKKDLFKAIFLSSDSESDNGEDRDADAVENMDNERFKSVLIGNDPGVINVHRNTSPPRGIFAKLDLDSMNKATSYELKGNDPCSEKLDKGWSAAEGTSDSKEIATEENVKDVVPEVGLLPEMYGPVLPAVVAPNENRLDFVQLDNVPGSQTEQIQSMVVPKHNSGKWIEKTREEKSKKEKKKKKKKNKKHKYEEHKKHKHKHKKDKRK